MTTSKVRKSWRAAKDMKALRFLLKHRKEIYEYIIERYGKESADYQEFAEIIHRSVRKETSIWAHRQVFLVSVESSQYIMPNIVENYVQTALKRFAKKDKDVDYFRGSPPPSFYVKMMYNINPRAGPDEGLREIVREMAFVRDFLVPYFEKIDPTPVGNDWDDL